MRTRIKDYSWKTWFAWRPVHTAKWLRECGETNSGQWVWLEYVEYRPIKWPEGFFGWVYRVKA